LIRNIFNPSLISANWVVIRNGTSVVSQRTYQTSGNISQHRTKIGPVPMWMILRLKRLSIQPQPSEGDGKGEDEGEKGVHDGFLLGSASNFYLFAFLFPP